MKTKIVQLGIPGIAFAILILDTKTALSGAAEGIELCIQTVIPSLFPFLFLSILLTNSLFGTTLSFLMPLRRLLHIRRGTEALLLMGFLGGYPVGAQNIAEAYHNDVISRDEGKRLLAFCSNAGPAFIFGMGSQLFPDNKLCWLLWLIHLSSAMLVGIFLWEVPSDKTNTSTRNEINSSVALQKAIISIMTVCGWVILFRVVIAFCNRWFLWSLPVWIQSIFCGLLELTNGCCLLILIPDIHTRFILFALFLSFGGLCVALQTVSVTNGLDRTLYLPGKAAQALLSVLMASAVFSREIRIILTIIVITLITVYLIRKNAKKDSILRSQSL